MVESPQRIWIEADDECPYFYEEDELHEVGQAVIEYTRSDLVAELEAENERLRRLVMAQSRAIHSPEALSRTGAVKVKALEYHLAQLRHAYSHLKTGGVVDQGTFADGLISPAIAAIETSLSALEPAAPEGQQEPVAYPKIMYCCEYCREHAPETCGYDRQDVYVMSDGRWLCGDCASEDCANDQPVYDLPHPPLLYTRPSEQAVTEAMVEAAANSIANIWCTGDLKAIARAALKAAMEAGR